MSEQKLKVFLCHASQDKPTIRELHQKLVAEVWIEPWLDEINLLPGMDWDLEIERAVESADAVIVCLSNKSATKEGYIQKEIRKVLDLADQKPDGTIYIVPLRLENCEPPPRLQKWQYTDYYPTNQRQNSLKRVLSSLRLRADKLGIKSTSKLLHQSNVSPEKIKVFKNDEIKSLLEWARMEKETRNVDRARELFAQALKVDPDNCEIWLEWARMEKEIRNIDRARELLAQALKVDPDNSEIWLEWAGMEKEIRNIDRARELYAEAIKRNKN